MIINLIKYHNQNNYDKSRLLKVATLSSLPLIIKRMIYFFLYLAASSEPPVAEPLLYEGAPIPAN